MAEILSARHMPAPYCVSDWVGDVAGVPRVWGRSDCVLSVADYVLKLTGIDPASRFRGRYDTSFGAQRLWRRNGGFLPMIRREMERCRFAEGTTPENGDVGIVMATSRFRQDLPAIGTVAAVRIGSLWGIAATDGIVAQDFETIAVWSMAPWTRS